MPQIPLYCVSMKPILCMNELYKWCRYVNDMRSAYLHEHPPTHMYDHQLAFTVDSSKTLCGAIWEFFMKSLLGVFWGYLLAGLSSGILVRFPNNPLYDFQVASQCKVQNSTDKRQPCFWIWLGWIRQLAKWRGVIPIVDQPHWKYCTLIYLWAVSFNNTLTHTFV